MDNEELRRLLEKFHQEMENAKDIDENGRELLRGIDADIRALLTKAEEHPASPQVAGRLEEAISQLEMEHPTLTAALSQLLAVLSNAGI